jgi:hypothetical protein
LNSLGGCANALTAGLLAAAARFGALLAMLHMRDVLFALVASGFADFGALAQQVLVVLGAAGHKAGGNGADVGAVAVNADTAGHHLHILFTKAGSSTMFAGGDAGVEGVEEALVLSVHGEKIVVGNGIQAFTSQSRPCYALWPVLPCMIRTVY